MTLRPSRMADAVPAFDPCVPVTYKLMVVALSATAASAHQQ